jgi:hypothetical protein
MNNRLWLSASIMAVAAACVAPTTTLPTAGNPAAPSAQASLVPSASPLASPVAPISPAPSAPAASPSPSPTPTPVPQMSALTFGPQSKLIGGNGSQGDFSGITDSGLPERRFMDTANAVVPAAGDKIYFLEGNRGRVAAWSAPFVRQSAEPYRIPDVVYPGLSRGADAIAYKDGLLVSDSFAHKVLYIKPDGTVSTFAGNGTAGYGGDGASATAASLDSPLGLAIDSKGIVYIADSNNNVVRKVDTSGRITVAAGLPGLGAEIGTFASGGKQLRIPQFVAVDRQDRLFIYDQRNQIRRLNADGTLEVIAGSGTYEQDIATQERPGVGLGRLLDMAIGPDGWLYYGDETNHVIRRLNVSLPTNELRSVTVAGSGKSSGFPYYDDLPTACTVSLPTALGFDASGNLYYFEGLTFRWITAPVVKS